MIFLLAEAITPNGSGLAKFLKPIIEIQMPKVEGYTDEQIFEIATKFAKETNRVYIAEALEKLLAEAQNKVLEILSSPVLADEVCVCLYAEPKYLGKECPKCGKRVTSG